MATIVLFEQSIHTSLIQDLESWSEVASTLTPGPFLRNRWNKEFVKKGKPSLQFFGTTRYLTDESGNSLSTEEGNLIYI